MLLDQRGSRRVGGALLTVGFAPSYFLLPFIAYIMKNIDNGQMSTNAMGALARMKARAAGSAQNQVPS